MRNLSEANVTDALTRVFDDTPDPRLKGLMQALVRHLHGFAREVQLTREEWAFAMDFLYRAGKISNEGRNEFILFSDTFGLSALVDLTNGGDGESETPASQLGPFFVDNLPVSPSNTVDLKGDLEGDPVLFCATVEESSGRPIPGALVDLWQTDNDGLYDVQIPTLKSHRLRCRVRTDADGKVFIKTIRPLGYTAPMDGPGGEMLIATKRNIWRPGHFHFKLQASGYRTVVTELFPEGDKFLDNDAAFGVRAPLVIDMPRTESAELAKQFGMPVPFVKVDYTFRLSPQR
jgi:protocatechuate 3,4-dioxygenase beta subunit